MRVAGRQPGESGENPTARPIGQCPAGWHQQHQRHWPVQDDGNALRQTQRKTIQQPQAGGEQQDGEGSHPGGHPAKFMQADVQPMGACGDRRCAKSPAELERCLGRLGTLYQNEQQSQCRDLNLPVAERGKCKNSRRTRQ